MKNKTPYEILSNKLNDLFFVYLDEVSPHFSMYPGTFFEEWKKFVSRHDFAQEWLVEENGWTSEEYWTESNRRFEESLAN